MGAQVRRKSQAYSQPLFGREGSGGRGASLREAASPPESPHRKSLREGARGRGLLYREAPSLALPSEETVWGRCWGRGRFSKRSASPPDPLSRRVAGDKERAGYAREAASLREAPPSRSLPKSGWRLGWLLLHSWFRLRGGRGFLLLGCGHGG